MVVLISKQPPAFTLPTPLTHPHTFPQQALLPSTSLIIEQRIRELVIHNFIADLHFSKIRGKNNIARGRKGIYRTA